MVVKMGTVRSGSRPQGDERARAPRRDSGRDRRTAGDPAPVSPPTGPVIPVQRQGTPGERRGAPTYVGRVIPPAAQQPGAPGRRAQVTRAAARPFLFRPPKYRYELTDLDDLFATARAKVDPDQERWHDTELRRTGWKVMVGGLVVVVVLTVVAAFFVADFLRGITSLLP